MSESKTTLCMGCGEDKKLNSEFLCDDCNKAAIRMLNDWTAHYHKWEKMTDSERWEKVKAAL